MAAILESTMKNYRHFQISRMNDILLAKLVDLRLFDTIIVNEFEDELLQLLDDERPKHLVVNFENVTQCSTSVINALLRAKKRLRVDGGDVKLCHMHPRIREAYKILNLDGTVFHIHDSEAEAIASFQYMEQ